MVLKDYAMLLAVTAALMIIFGIWYRMTVADGMPSTQDVLIKSDRVTGLWESDGFARCAGVDQTATTKTNTATTATVSTSVTQRSP